MFHLMGIKVYVHLYNLCFINIINYSYLINLLLETTVVRSCFKILLMYHLLSIIYGIYYICPYLEEFSFVFFGGVVSNLLNKVL